MNLKVNERASITYLKPEVRLKIKVLLINPWIYDFAAVNLWSRPLGLLKVAECLSRFDVGISMIDCMDMGTVKSGPLKYPKDVVDKPACIRRIPRRFGRYGISPESFKAKLARAAPFDVVFVSSLMSYWYPGVQEAIRIVRDFSKDLPVVLGGVYATLWHRHACSESGADFIYKGPANENIKFVFDTFGFKIRRKAQAETPYYKLGLHNKSLFAPLLTGTGCPFSCSYCASVLLSGPFSRRDPLDVVREIRDLRDLGVREFAFYDDALLADAEGHIKIILREIARLDPGLRFHCPNGLHVRFIDEELAALMKGAGFTTIRLGLETADETRQEKTGGKVRSEELADAVRKLKGMGFSKREIGVYLMYGLPGQGLPEVKDGIEFLKGLDVKIHLAEFSPIPGTESWRELVERGTIDEAIDPLITNNTVFSHMFSGYDPEQLKRLKLEVKEYNLI